MTITRQGRCVLPADESGRVLDRLAGLEKVITPALVEQVLLASRRINRRACKFTHEVMLPVVLAMGIFTDLPIRQVFKHTRRLRVGEDVPHRSSLCVARQRLGIRPLRLLFQQTVRPLAEPDTPGAFYHGLRLVGIDGTVFNVPDTPANRVRSRSWSIASRRRCNTTWPSVRWHGAGRRGGNDEG